MNPSESVPPSPEQGFRYPFDRHRAGDDDPNGLDTIFEE